MVEDAARAALWALRRRADGAERVLHRTRRARLVATTRAAAFRGNADLHLDVAADVELGRRVRITVEPNTTNRLVIGPGCRLFDGVLIRLQGGDVELGERVELRRGVVLTASGRLRLRGDNMISWQSTVHCAGTVDIGAHTITGDQVTFADSRHVWTEPDAPVWHNVDVGSVRVGRNSWIASKATVSAGADIGDHCLVAAGAVVTGVVPDGHLAVGAPARCRPMDLPWRSEPTED